MPFPHPGNALYFWCTWFREYLKGNTTVKMEKPASTSRKAMWVFHKNTTYDLLHE
jgi:hypothetical protein